MDEKSAERLGVEPADDVLVADEEKSDHSILVLLLLLLIFVIGYW